jgi:hypothetical protein
MHKASAAHRQVLAGSLRERLALLEHGVVPVPPPKPSARVRQPGAKSRKPVARASFGLGLACGGLLGAVALLVLMLAPPEEARSRRASAPPDASASLAADPPSTDGSAHVTSAASVPPSPTAPSIDSLPWGPASVSRAQDVATPFRTEVHAIARAEEPASAAALPRPPLPEGLSSLGGPVNGAAAPMEAGRKMWWRMPTPAWTPFADGASGN